MRFKLRFAEHRIRDLAAGYAYAQGDDAPEALASAARRRGYLTKPEFLALAEWKSPRTRPRCARNAPAFIKSVTSTSFGTTNEELKLRVLTLLDGVSVPTASVLLHFCDRRQYPILDYRALWSLSCEVPPAKYTFDLWRAYCLFTRALARRQHVPMRVLDRALWQYSKERQ